MDRREGRMSIMSHIGELRQRMMIMAGALVIASIVLYFAAPVAIDFLMNPIKAFLPNDGSLNVLSPLGGFTLRFKVAFFLALIVTSPLLLFEILGFFLPALKPNERKWVIPTVIALVALFALGMVFCYLVIQPAAFSWMIDQSNAFATVIPNAEEFLSIFLLLEIAFGVAFEIPLVIFYLLIFHIVSYKTMRMHWRGIYVGLAIFSAVVTPDGSPVTMFFMLSALVLLYESSLAFAKTVLIKREGKEALYGRSKKEDA